MKYMTPDLLARFQTTDDAEAGSVAEQWDRQCEEYGKHLKTIKADLGPGARSFLRRFRLHDAKMLTTTVDKKKRLSIFLDLGKVRNPNDRYLELQYLLAGEEGPGFELLRHAALSGHGKAFSQWLYDEIDVASSGLTKVTSHSILLSGGWELLITFSRLRIRTRRLSLSPGNVEEMATPPCQVA